MKAKELKALRKKIERADREEEPLSDLAGRKFCKYDLQLNRSNAFQLVAPERSFSNRDAGDENSSNINCDAVTNKGEMDQSKSSLVLSLTWFKTWSEINPSYLFQEMLDLFKQNVGTMYEQSSWGLNMEGKKEELQHRKARFLIVTTASPLKAVSKEKKEYVSSLVAFCHYRFEYDDDQYPTCAVLYLYEIQVSRRFQSRGIGQSLMELLRCIAEKASMTKIILTVFRLNHQALKFYRSLNYKIDESSPSEDDGNGTVDYLILSKNISSNE